MLLDDVSAEFPEAWKMGKRHAYYGVYDGHGGKEAAELCEAILHKNIFSDAQYATDVEAALRSSFALTDAAILERSVAEQWKSGTTVVLGILMDSQLIIANTGDSEAVLGVRTSAGYEPLVLSEKHKPSDPAERDRIKKAGGHVVFGRVMGSLAVARSLGDRDFKHPYNKADDHFVSATPYISKMELQPEHEFMIISCDGLWDKMKYQHAIDLVARWRKEGKSAKDTARLLVEEAIELGSLDNVTAIIIYLPKDSSKRDMNKKKKKKKSATKAEMLDVYQFLKTEMDRIKGPDDKSKQPCDDSPKGEQVKHFDLNGESVLDEFSCMLEKKMLYQGTMLITPNRICFYSNTFGKKTRYQVSFKDIQCIEKTKALLVTNAIRIVTKDGKKHLFNWKQSSTARDEAFSKLLKLVDQSQPNSEESSPETRTNEERNKEESNESKEEGKGHQQTNGKEGNGHKNHSDEKPQTKQTEDKGKLAWSRFD